MTRKRPKEGFWEFEFRKQFWESDLGARREVSRLGHVDRAVDRPVDLGPDQVDSTVDLPVDRGWPGQVAWRTCLSHLVLFLGWFWKLPRSDGPNLS